MHFTGRAFLLNVPVSSCQGLIGAKLSSAIISQETLLSARKRSVANGWPRHAISDIAVSILHIETEYADHRVIGKNKLLQMHYSKRQIKCYKNYKCYNT